MSRPRARARAAGADACATATVPAFAKVNLGLRILYKRPDNYHELRTVFQTISVADQLTVSYRRAPKTRIRIEGAPEIEDNLVEKAARLVLEELSARAEVDFVLKKNIPMGAGLGGGSSDAAAVLLALPVLIGKAISAERLQGIAATLGSDVAFFLHGGTALGIGRGEELYPLPDLPACRGILVLPGVHSSTAEAYRSLSAGLTSFSLQNKINSFQLEVWRGAADGNRGRLGGVAVDDNDFEEVVFGQYPELRSIKERLVRAGAKPAAMTGSGSAIFGIFPESGQAERAAKKLPNYKVLSFALVSRARYRSVWRRALELHVEGTLWPPRSLYARDQYER